LKTEGEGIMKTFHGGETVKGGFYWRRAGWRMVTVEGETGSLPGDGAARYVRLPALLMVPLALVMGGLFVLFLPLIGFLILGEWAFTAVGRVARRAFGRSAAVRAPASGGR
jgi:hypothetical protein